MHKDPRESQRSFRVLFLLVMVIEVLASIAFVGGDEALAMVSAVWFGPLDDIFFFLLALQALCYLVDPFGRLTLDQYNAFSLTKLRDSLKSESDFGPALAKRFATGSCRALVLLGLVNLLVVPLAKMVPIPVFRGLNLVCYRHLSWILPIALILNLGLLFLRLTTGSQTVAAAGLLGLLGIAAHGLEDGRFSSHLFQLYFNLESIQAWLVTLAWVAFFYSLQETEEAPEFVGAPDALGAEGI